MPTRPAPTIPAWVWVAIALVALVATWSNNIAFMVQHRADPRATLAPLAFARALYANPASASFSNDLLLVGLAAGLFMVVEARRLGMKGVWWYLILSVLIAISVFFPLFLLARQRRMAQLAQTAR